MSKLFVKSLQSWYYNSTAMCFLGEVFLLSISFLWFIETLCQLFTIHVKKKILRQTRLEGQCISSKAFGLLGPSSLIPSLHSPRSISLGSLAHDLKSHTLFLICKLFVLGFFQDYPLLFTMSKFFQKLSVNRLRS